MVYSSCPNCKAKVILGSRPKVGEMFACFECETDLELVWLDPPELDWPWEYKDDKTFVYDDVGMDPY